MVFFHFGPQIPLEGEVSSLCCLSSYISDIGQPMIVVPLAPQSSGLKALDSHVPCAHLLV
ncbi:rCG31419 [Rattus norvegicus]|uniref:RCG31419 n=1 Tax=Rattus norvegicus TaxID=10116 RepID=A6IUV7_RAT|nr:rCG31419 [Rattus norvegicus]